jgi:hypothetical protein
MTLRTRRGAGLLLVSVLVVLAGCSAVPGIGGESTALTLVNQDDVDHAVVVEIGQLGDDPDPPYTAGRLVDAESDETLAAFDRTGEYVVTVSVDGETSEESYTFESGKSPVTIGIDNDGSVVLEP